MHTVKLSDGKELTIDLTKVKVKEWRQMVSPESEIAESDAILSRIVGVKDVSDLSYPDYRLVVDKVLEVARSPLEDPH